MSSYVDRENFTFPIWDAVLTRLQLPVVFIYPAEILTISYFTSNTLVNRLVRRTYVSSSLKTGNTIGGVDFADLHIFSMEKRTKRPFLFLPFVRFLCDISSLHVLVTIRILSSSN